MFFDRRSAGALLAENLRAEDQPVIIGIPRGGIIVGAPIAQALGAPLDVRAIRKVGHPRQPELAIGAVSADGETVVNENADEFSSSELETLFDAGLAAAKALERKLRGNLESMPLHGRTAIIVDDGIATSATMQCAANATRGHATRVVCAVPVAPESCIAQLRSHCDRIVVLAAARDPQFAVSRYYVHFGEVSESDVRDELRRAAEHYSKVRPTT